MIQKITFRDQVKEELLGAMFSGEIEPGARISLVDIARKLDVSVTPVREALTQLTETRIVNYIPNRGFVVSDLNENEALDLYEAISLIESALLLTCQFDTQAIIGLEISQKSFLNAKSKTERVHSDMMFHKTLIGPAKNNLLKKIIEDVRIRVFFYELEYMSLDDLKVNSDESHDQIISFLKEGNLTEASAVLRLNWKLSIDRITSKMRVEEKHIN
ncbi:MAG: GntR family transcriptional regulator [Cryomorphaceae bacterium]|nr:GntR family transcriptional regulator [Cryomorphaceae bacterium]